MTPPNVPVIDLKQPTPVRAAFYIYGGIVALVISVFPVLQIFGVITWTGDQLGAVVAFLTVSINTVGAVISSIWAENRVTPVESPRDNNLTPLVPIASDGYED